MPSAREQRATLQLLTAAAVEDAQSFLAGTVGSPEQRRLQMLDTVPSLIGYYADGSSALAADFYEESREAAAVRSVFQVVPVVADRTVKIRRGIAWAAEPLFGDVDADPAERLAEVVQLESARPYRDTILSNRRQDPAAVGWARATAGGCKFCLMLADRGAVYREQTANFAAHSHCHCTAYPVFKGGEHGPEANAVQYLASRRSRSPAQRAYIRAYLNENYPDVHG
ncbi:hypothetical protein [Curtobacterium sp. MCBD17_030]|uniref:VG15 protein n=1 Tax=Curtobacterium sp. MCBD17_030 TaxID=2175649 RepID=UPI000D868F97|nr:hypothetical protein [Curtobacterium sp. MCBD17_030]PYY32362.1 hypothetical protein DEI89_13080 [Curtobacterium sp. MCBD17_030]